MGIPESQLETWSAQGSVQQSSATYQTVKLALESKDAPYYGKSTVSFLQGSYGNDTNVWADSDVDVVMKTDSIFYYDISRITSEAEQTAFHKSLVSGGGYSFDKFKADVTTVLKGRFGADAMPDDKVIWVKPNNGRRNTDVLPAVQFRRYYRYTGAETDYAQGICFWPNGKSRVENYPKKHSENMTTKHQATGNRLKPAVRQWKNLRNRMIQDGAIKGSLAPSYYLEGLLYNVPTDKFVTSRVTTFENCWNWLSSAKREDLVCASNMFWLLRDNAAESWSPQSCQTFLTSVQTVWNQW